MEDTGIVARGHLRCRGQQSVLQAGGRNAYANSNGNTECDSYSYANFDATTTTYTYTNCNNDTNSYGDTYTDANSKPIWECMPAANDGEP